MRDDECPWCSLLLPPDGRAAEPPPGRRHPATRLRTVMVALSALVTLVAATVTLWRT
ncbi:hypothetical protein [Streptomyces bauhiniae]|uniref:Uncharacterized protein n=1 Tax=Streptomyces bauhiniae TaxID=2340725 RepID=A0A7K3QTV8_9ACTN|nr:hypothetical protein [Streptomyces bauhiniae]NEB93344.1 hypothetical protein [Streptomyces bauhiniae]